jgi:serine phosphatase RsbU (regulator of sigma subunit)
MLRDVLEASAAAWAMWTRRSQRWLALAVFLTPGASFFALMAGYFAPPRWSGVADTLFNDFEVAGALLITAILVTRAWRAWRARDELRIEFEAAAEVQQQLVSPAVDLPGFQIRSIYLPARQVGGDFFRVLHQADGGVLVVMGDVSGKGLKAAMTVSAIMGALPGCHSRHVSIDGAMTLANAGNPAPYRNGQEMVVESGLPLGVLADVSYPQTSDQLAGGDRLTFVSDGVIEATSASGELYGFDRTEATSVEDADQIAHAAQAFGQEDDITVLTLTFAGSEGMLA